MDTVVTENATLLHHRTPQNIPPKFQNTTFETGAYVSQERFVSGQT